MTDEQRQKIINLRAAGNGYKKISKLLGLSENTVKSFCQTELLDAAAQFLDGTFDESAFSRDVRQVTLYNDRIEFSMQNGNCKTIIREYSGQIDLILNL